MRFLFCSRVRGGSRADGRRGFGSGDGGPFANVPAPHRSAGYIGIGLGEVLCYGGRVSFEEQHCTIDRICERPAQHEFSTIASLPRFFEMLVSKLSAFGDIVLIRFVK